MVSKAVVCFVILATVATCYSSPVYQQKRDQNQKIGCSNRDLNSGEYIQEPCDLLSQQKSQMKKKMQADDSSSNESQDNSKKVKILVSQEDQDNSKEIHQAPEHERVHQANNGPDFMRGQQVINNEQKSRKNYENNYENNDQAEINQIERQRHY